MEKPILCLTKLTNHWYQYTSSSHKHQYTQSEEKKTTIKLITIIKFKALSVLIYPFHTSFHTKAGSSE
jgi:hypothetical protein